MCNRARVAGEPHTIRERFGTEWLAARPMDNRFREQEWVRGAGQRGQDRIWTACGAWPGIGAA